MPARAGSDAADQIGTPRPLHRPRQEPHTIQSVELAGTVDHVAGPQRVEDLETLVEQGGVILRICGLSERRVLGIARYPETDTEHGPPSRQVVDSRHLARQHPRSPAGDRGDEGAETNP
jgi:hypothetical protein